MKIKKVAYLAVVGLGLSQGYLLADTASADTNGPELKQKLPCNKALAKNTGDKDPWSGTKISAGAVINTGNTQSQNYNTEGDLNYNWGLWTTNNKVTFQRASSANQGVSAQSFLAQTIWQYNFTPSGSNYVYFLGSYLNNRFDGYDFVTNENLGYGRRISMPQSMALSFFLGPGLRQERIQNSDSSIENEPSLQVGANYAWQINDKTTLSELYQTTTTKENTNTTSTTSLITNLVGNVSFSINYTVTYNSKPVSGKLSLDTATTFNLVYNF